MKATFTAYITEPNQEPQDPGVVVPDVRIDPPFQPGDGFYGYRGSSATVLIRRNGEFIGWAKVGALPGSPDSVKEARTRGLLSNPLSRLIW